MAYLEQAILEGVGQTMHRQGLAPVPGGLDSGAGADVEHLADDIQLTQPAPLHDCHHKLVSHVMLDHCKVQKYHCELELGLVATK